MDELANTLIINIDEADDIEQYPNEVEGFITLFSEIKATEALTSLANHSFTHGLVRTAPTDAD